MSPVSLVLAQHALLGHFSCNEQHVQMIVIIMRRLQEWLHLHLLMLVDSVDDDIDNYSNKGTGIVKKWHEGVLYIYLYVY